MGLTEKDILTVQNYNKARKFTKHLKEKIVKILPNFLFITFYGEEKFNEINGLTDYQKPEDLLNIRLSSDMVQIMNLDKKYVYIRLLVKANIIKQQEAEINGEVLISTDACCYEDYAIPVSLLIPDINLERI